MPFCPTCNKFLAEPTDAYCPDCGTRLIPQPTTMTRPPVGVRPVPPNPSGLSPRGKLVAGIVVLVIAIIVIGGVASALSGGHTPQPSSSQGGGGSGSGVYSLQITQSGQTCNGGNSWTLQMGTDNGPASHAGCGDWTAPGQTANCRYGDVWVQDYGATTRIAIVKDGQVVAQKTGTVSVIMKIDYPTVCGGPQ